MENQNPHTPKENVKPVSRKTNEEIDADDEGNLIIGGEILQNNQTELSDGPFSEDLANGNNNLTDNQNHSED
ncbi:hypothetical protein [Pedobacter frigiditerrae]|uniref:hypothetical protein n=1 Tax=Pedobacter frigiditerrae TaxID=2530452 RepID=UPI00293096DD|nr:hypothetical protein [Pedobacter frigiditerrae]